LEFFLQRLLKRKQMRLHQLRALQQSLFADLEWDMEFNEGVIDAHSLPKEALSEEEYQTMLFGSDMPADNDETNENQRMTNHGDGKSTTAMERIVHASAWNEFDEKIDFSRSFLQSKSKLRTIARSIGDVLSQSSDSVRTSRPPYDVSKLDLSHYIQQEELREQQERQRRRVSSRPSDWRPSRNSSNCSSASSTPHRNATSSTTAHDHRSEDRARSGASASSSSSSPDRSMIPAPRDSHHHRFPVDISQPLAPEAMTTTRVESLASSPTSSPGQHHRSATISLYSIPDSPPPAAAPAAIRRQSPSPTHRQEQAESPSRRPMDDPDSRANTTAHRPTAAVTVDTNSRRAEDELPPLGRKGSGGVSRSHSHDAADLGPLGGRTTSSRVDAPLPVKPWGVAATAAAATAAAMVDDLDPWMLGISAIEARDSDSDYDAVMLFPAMKATRRPSSSSSDKPQRSDFDPVDSFLSTNRSSRSQSFDAHPPPRPPPTTDEGHVAFVDQRPPEAMDLFALASQDLDTLLGLANDGEEDPDNDEQPMRHGGPSLVSSLNSPPPMPKTPIGKPPFSPF
jgi:hypothetical protein